MKPLRTSRYKLTAGLNRLSRRLSSLSVKLQQRERMTAVPVSGIRKPFRESVSPAKIERPHAPEEFPKRTAPLLF